MGDVKKIAWRVVVFLAAAVIFYFVAAENYLFFHVSTEMFSVLIAFGVFLLAWNSRQFMQNDFLLFLGISFLFIGGIDFLHTLTYKGMGVLNLNESNTATQLWISGRYLESFSFLIAPIFFRKKLNYHYAFLAFSLVILALFLSIFTFDIFPDAYVTGKGLTSFKIISEYIIIAILLGSLLFLHKFKNKFDKRVFYLVSFSIVLTVFSEFSFTFYNDVYGLSNQIGHYLKILAFYLIYKAVIETGIKDPHAILMRDLQIAKDQITAEKEKLQKYLETAGSLILILNKDETINYINCSGCRIIGYKKNEIIGKNLYDTLVPEKYREKYRKKFQNIIKGLEKPVQNSIRKITAKTGEEKTLSLTYTRIFEHDPDKKITGLLCSGQDITDRIKAEEKTNDLLKALRSKHKELQNFIDSVRHDLGNLLFCVKSYCKVLGRSADKLENCFKEKNLNFDFNIQKNLKEPVKTIENAEAQMGRLLDNLKKLSKIGKLPLNIDKINIEKIVKDIEGRMNSELDGVDFIVDPLPSCYGDKIQIDQVFSNLINNAVKYLDPQRKGKIKINAKQDGDKNIYCIEDNGIGISEQEQEEIFNIFYRAQNDLNVDGEGIGLPMVKRIIERHNGDIRVKAEKNKGSTFYVALPNKKFSAEI